MKLRVFIRPVGCDPRRSGQRMFGRLAAIALITLFSNSLPASADNTGYEGYEDYYYTPQERIIIPAPYTIDPVNRRSSLTPEPVWRNMFPSIHERSAVEERTFGVPGASNNERRYWRAWERRNRR